MPQAPAGSDKRVLSALLCCGAGNGTGPILLGARSPSDAGVDARKPSPNQPPQFQVEVVDDDEAEIENDAPQAKTKVPMPSVRSSMMSSASTMQVHAPCAIRWRHPP
eukprot:TRINITY_DN51750_c0_g1_i1.p1 TRINITY_DN51750_c0_g1~~TRINITY_DN51750_c0_g1_i1.p1  ORF type:complete len:122 (-),score=22.05 TRINITY_DN51750_c0_g1_i1:117-437(-)